MYYGSFQLDRYFEWTYFELKPTEYDNTECLHSCWSLSSKALGWYVNYLIRVPNHLLLLFMLLHTLGHFKRDSREVLDLIVRLITNIKKKGSTHALDQYLNAMNLTILYQLSRPVDLVHGNWSYNLVEFSKLISCNFTRTSGNARNTAQNFGHQVSRFLSGQFSARVFRLYGSLSTPNSQ
jgi:hypothetical protein